MKNTCSCLVSTLVQAGTRLRPVPTHPDAGLTGEPWLSALVGAMDIGSDHDIFPVLRCIKYARPVVGVSHLTHKDRARELGDVAMEDIF